MTSSKSSSKSWRAALAVIVLALTLPPLVTSCWPTMPSRDQALEVLRAACVNDPDVIKLAQKAGVPPEVACEILIRSFAKPDAGAPESPGSPAD